MEDGKSEEAFAEYCERCVDHMKVDFLNVCGRFNDQYLEDFMDCWRRRDNHGSGVLHMKQVMDMAKDLTDMGYESWRVDSAEEESMRNSLDRGGSVTLRDLCLYAERDEEYVIAADGSETVRRLLHGNDDLSVPERLAPAFASVFAHSLAHLAIDLGCSSERAVEAAHAVVLDAACWVHPEADRDTVQNCVENVLPHPRLRWFLQAWARYGNCFVLASRLPWRSVEKLLAEAVEKHKITRFSRHGRWTTLAWVEAAEMLRVSRKEDSVSFLELCCIVESPEKWRPRAAELQAAAAVAEWSTEFHAEVICRFFHESLFHRQVRCLIWSSAQLKIPIGALFSVFRCMHRDLRPCEQK